jgi:hypothetical protein
MSDVSPGDRYIALGSSFAAGPRLRPHSPGSPRRAMRSSVNYVHLLAERLGLHLRDASWSGETAVRIADGRPGRPAQLAAVTADTRLVTLACGGNDVGYVARLTLASLPRPLQQAMGVRRGIAEIGDEGFEALACSFDRIPTGVRRRHPRRRSCSSTTSPFFHRTRTQRPTHSRPPTRLPATAARGSRTSNSSSGATRPPATRRPAVNNSESP